MSNGSGRKRHQRRPGTDMSKRRLALILLVLSGGDATVTYSRAQSSSQTNSFGCFVHPNKARHCCSRSDLQILSSIRLTSTKEDYYDTLQEEIARERRTKRLLPRHKVHKRRRNKQLREHLNVQVSSDGYNDARKSKRKRKLRGSKSLPRTTVAQIITGESVETLQPRQSMPPWLARYENEEFEPYVYEEAANSEAPPKSYSDEILAAQKLKRLEQAMYGVFPGVTSTMHTAPSFSQSDILDVLDSIRVSSQNNLNLIMGCADFLYLMLSLEENDDVRDIGSDFNELVPKTLIMTREVLIAAAFHYCDCVRARKAGVYDVVKAFMEAGNSGNLLQGKQDEQQQSDNLVWLPSVTNDSQDARQNEDAAAIVMTKTTVHRRGKSPIDRFGEETVQIAAGAAKLKRAEVMATAVNVKYESDASRIKSKSITTNNLSSDASILRSFLVSISEDWRALVIRSAACLYRLKGIVDEGNNSIIPRSSNGRLIYSSTSMQTARDALRVYAPLAQRMGMQRLKTQIENTAFRILYPRQFDVSSALHDRDLGDMQTIIQVLSTRIEQLLMSDEVFMSNIDNVSVSSRIKEPYSLWKKILRYRKEAVSSCRNGSCNANALKSTTLSTKWVPDAIALRVIIRGKQMPMEDEESLRTREKMLCYFALQMIGDVWPASEANFAKDYISNPKPNGYQSLHYTAALMINGDEWPFEVQIRTEAMHKIAEYGVAAHWDYKLQNKMTKAFNEGSTEQPLALPGSVDAETVEPLLSELPTDDIIKQAPDITPSKDRVGSYIDALTTSRESLVKNNVFIFISSSENALDGRIVSIDPASSRVSDVLKQYGSTMSSAIPNEHVMYRNGVSISQDESLSNGDVLTLPACLIEQINF